MRIVLTASVLAGALLFLLGMALRGEKPCAEPTVDRDSDAGFGEAG